MGVAGLKFKRFEVKQYNTDVETYKVTNNGFTQKAEDDLVIGIMTSAGYFFILIILMVGIALGDNEDNGMVHTLLLFNFFGCLLFMAIGAEQIHVYRNATSGKSTANGMGAMAILTSLIF